LQWFFTHHLVLEQNSTQSSDTRDAGDGTMAALKLDYSVLDAPQRATDRIEADL